MHIANNTGELVRPGAGEPKVYSGQAQGGNMPIRCGGVSMVFLIREINGTINLQ